MILRDFLGVSRHIEECTLVQFSGHMCERVRQKQSMYSTADVFCQLC